jgi:hypothetical protein
MDSEEKARSSVIAMGNFNKTSLIESIPAGGPSDLRYAGCVRRYRVLPERRRTAPPACSSECLLRRFFEKLRAKKFNSIRFLFQVPGASSSAIFICFSCASIPEMRFRPSLNSPPADCKRVTAEWQALADIRDTLEVSGLAV